MTLLHSTKPALYRPFHHTRIWLADEQNKTPAEREEEASAVEAETTDETLLPESSEVETEDLPEESISAAAETSEEAAASAASDAILESSAATGELAAEESSSITREAQEASEPGAFETAGAATSSSFPPRREQRGRPAFPADTAGFTRDNTPSRILYIGNLFFEVTAAQLEQEFQRLGEIANSRVVTDSRGLSKGFGYVEFASQESADKAVRELDQKVFQGRRMAVQYHVRREPRRFDGGRSGGGGEKEVNPPSKTLFIGNMSYQMSDKDLNSMSLSPASLKRANPRSNPQAQS